MEYATSRPPANQAAQFPMATLYVGDLHPDVTEAMLYQKFSQVGQVVSIRVCRDILTKKSLGYAYVNFHTPADAERALDAYNFDTIRDYPMRIMWSQRDPSLRKSGQGNVFIKNLDKSIDNKMLYDTFSTFGNILSCKVAYDSNGSKGYGFVHFEDSSVAKAVINEVNGMLIKDKEVYVGPFIPRKEREEAMGDKMKKFTNVYIKNLDEDTTDEELMDLFKEFGEIVSAKVMRGDEGKTKGFGFVSFRETDSAARAVAEMNGKEYKDKQIFVGRAQKKAERQTELRQKFERVKAERQKRYEGINLYVKNLDDGIDDERLRKEFEKWGEITSAKVMTDENGRTKGFGFVCFGSPDEATRAVNEMNGLIVGSKPLYVALAQRKEERQNILQYQQRMPYGRGAGPIAGAAPMPMYGQPGAPTGNVMYFNQFGQTAQATRYMNPQLRGGTARPAGAWQVMRPGTALNTLQPTPAAGFRAQVGAPAMGGRMPAQQVQYPLAGGSQAAAQLVQQQRIQQQQQQMAAAQQLSRPITGQPTAAGQPAMQMGQAGMMAGQQRMVDPTVAAQMQGQSAMRMQPTVAAALQEQRRQQMATAGQAVRPIMTQSLAPTRPQLQPQQQAIHIHGQEPLTAQMLAAADAKDQKQMLGERLYPLISQMLSHTGQSQQVAGKITGMLLEIDNSELLNLLDDRNGLEMKFKEALDVYVNHQHQQQIQQQAQTVQQQQQAIAGAGKPADAQPTAAANVQAGQPQQAASQA